MDVLACVIAGLRRDWRRVEEDVVQDAVGVVPTVWFRGVQARLTKAQFLARWPSAGDWYHVAEDPPGVMPRLSTTWPEAARWLFGAGGMAQPTSSWLLATSRS